MSASPVVGTWKTAYRVFAAESDDTSLSCFESDKERAPNYVVTPIGTRLNRMFTTDVLTEVEHVNDEVFRGRIVDPVGAFATYVEQYQSKPMAYLDAVTPPAFVSLAGKTHTYEPDDADVVYSSVHPESISIVNADVCDRWIVSATEATLRRIMVFDEVPSMPYRGDNLARVSEARGIDSMLAAGIPRATDHCGTTRTYLEVLREVTVQALELVVGDCDQVDPLDVAPGDGGDAVLGPLPELDLKLAASVDIEVGEADVGEAEADVGEFENESGSEPATTLDSEPEFDDGVEFEAVEPESEPEPIAEPDSESESTSDPEPIAVETTVAVESRPGASESEPVSEPSTTVDSEPEPESTAEPEPKPAVEPDLMSGSGPEPVIDSLDTESEPDLDDDALGDFEGDAPDAGVTDTGPLDDSGSGTFDDFDDGFDGPDPEAGDSADSTDSTFADADDLADPDGMHELNEDERAGIESEFGTELISGTDVDLVGEVDIGAPDTDDLTEQLEDESAAAAGSDLEPAIAAAEPEPAVDSESEPTPDAAPDGDEDEASADPDADESAEGIDLESAVVDAMDDLDDGDGATHDEVIAAVVDEHDADPGAIEDAIQEVFLGGRCYESQDGALRAI